MNKLFYIFLLSIPAIIIASDGPSRPRRRARVITPEQRILLEATLQADKDLAAAKAAKEKTGEKPPVSRPNTYEFAKIDELEKIVIPVPNKDLGTVALTLIENDEPTEESLTYETFVDLIKARLNTNTPYILAHVRTIGDDKKEYSHFFDATELNNWLQNNVINPINRLPIDPTNVTYYKLEKLPDGFVYIGSKADVDAKKVSLDPAVLKKPRTAIRAESA